MVYLEQGIVSERQSSHMYENENGCFNHDFNELARFYQSAVGAYEYS